MLIRLSGLLAVSWASLAIAGGPLSSGSDHLLFLRDDGSLWAAGSGAYGQLGKSGKKADASHPLPFQVIDGKWNEVSAGEGYSMALRDDGSLWAFGRNDAAQLGKLTRRIVSRPQRAGEHHWIDVAAGGAATLAIRSDSSLRIWGGWKRGGPAQPLSGLKGMSRSAASVDWRWSKVAIGAEHGLAIRNDGSLWALGSGELGCAGRTSARSVCRVSHARWTAIAAGDGFSAGIREDGSLWTWGRNDHGQLGRGAISARDSMGRVGAERWLAVAAGARHALALRADGSLWAWGFGGDGALGDGDRRDRTEPAPVDGGKWRSIAAGRGYSFARRADGTLMAWGDLGFATPAADSARAIALRPVLLERGLALGALPAATYGDKPVAVSVDAFRGDDVSLESADAGVAAVDGRALAIRGAGSTTVRVRATPRPGWGVTDTLRSEAVFTVAKAPQAISFDALADARAGSSGFALRAASSAGLPVLFRSADQRVARVAGSRLKPASAGETEIMALQPGDANHLPAATVTRKLRVLASAPAAPAAVADASWAKAHEAWLWAGGAAVAAAGGTALAVWLWPDGPAREAPLGTPPADPVVGGAP
jgi:alpha-tubulin suppressor-like RCC1 family protein